MTNESIGQFLAQIILIIVVFLGGLAMGYDEGRNSK